MWDVLSIPDPCNKAKNWALFKKQARFPLEYIKSYMKKFAKTADKYELQNLDWSGNKYIRNTLTPQLLAKVVEEVSISESGLETIIAVMTIIYSGASYNALKQCKTKLKGLTLKGFPGENIVDLNKEVSALSERIDSADMMTPGNNLLLKIVKVSEGSSEPQFNQWAYKTYDLVLAFVEACRVSSPNVIKIEQFDYEKLSKLSNKQYQDMMGGGQWPQQRKL
jgi:hypothetical protein